ncbi:hypothetical protein ASF10_08900 [Flavobacterium sp. Leaf82]|uniref:hypothetical protein n=1 Tax=unclassified Flavobacterium TaxID=196869 RepID=UPI0006FD18B6|nr:hypothetical protein [Flavobacterium sp. Leaf82]KQO22484.1 hypothetical protein ASF10_08900 [Flavobacterium sp. Leaf82]
MKHQEYILFVKEKVSLLNQDNLLFWDLWCLNYVFEKIKNKSYPFYTYIEKSYKLLWDYNDKINNNLDDILNDESIDSIMNFDNDDFDNLDEFDVEEKAIQEMIVGLESIILNFKESLKLVYNAYENPINVIDVEIDGILISKENENEIYLNETNSQMSLLEDLSSNVRNYTFINRNIYR